MAVDNGEYQLLAPLDPTRTRVELLSFEYFTTAYTVIISAIIALAFIMIVISGIQYSSSFASPSSKSDAIKRIQGAVGGLVLALLSFLLLRTINPDLVSPSGALTNLPNPGGTGIDPSNPLWPGDTNGNGIPRTEDPDEGPDNLDPGANGGNRGGLSELNARNFLEQANSDPSKPRIEVNGTCTTSSCHTRLEGIKQSTLEEAIAFRDACGCAVTITAGTEYGHSTRGSVTHGNGYKFDMRLTPQAESYIASSGRFTRDGTRSDGAQIWRKNGSNATYYRESNHWDVAVK